MVFRRMHPVGWLLLVASLMQPGCAHHHCAKLTPAVESVSFVDVGGAVESPQRMDFTSEGLSLRKALIRAGGLKTSTPSPIPASRAVVMLQRGSGVIAQTFHFPLPLVENDLAGDVPLAHNDTVQVVDVQQTSLLSSPPEVRNPRISVRGLVRQSGPLFTQNLTPAAEGGRGFTTISDVATIADRRNPPTVIVLTRPRSSGIGTDQFILPLGGFAGIGPRVSQPAPVAPAPVQGSSSLPALTPDRSAVVVRPGTVRPGSAASPLQPSPAPELPVPVPLPVDGTAVNSAQAAAPPFAAAAERSLLNSLIASHLNAPIHHGDDLTFTRLEGVPVVLSGVVSSMLRQQNTANQRRCKLAAHLRPNVDGADASQTTATTSSATVMGLKTK